MTAVASTAALRPTSRDPMHRLERLLDTGSVTPIDDPDGSGVRTARGTADGTAVITYISDPRTMGGALGSSGCRRIVNAIELAMTEQVPVIGVWHSGGARLAEGVGSLDGMGEMFAAIVRASGRVPQVSVVVGPAAGGAAYGPALTDIVVMAGDARLFVTGPDVIRQVTGEVIDMERLGGPNTHVHNSGVAHVAADDELDAYRRARVLIGLLDRKPGEGWSRSGIDPGDLLPDKANRAYDIRPIIETILDLEAGAPAWQELQEGWAPNIVVGLGRLEGRPVGVVANNPIRKGGCLDADSADKAARFVRMCDTFGVPLVVLVDVPGYLPGVEQEWDGVVRRGAKLLHAFADAVVPRVTLVARKAYGGAYIAMNSRSLGASTVFAWPRAEVAVMGDRAAVGILHRKELMAADDEQRPALEERLVAQHHRTVGGIDRAVQLGVVDRLVEFSETRREIAQALVTAEERCNVHRNIPL